MIDQSMVSAARAATVHDRNGNKIGKAGDVYLDDASGRPEWVTVNTGLLGSRESFVPLSGATLDGDRLVVPFDEATVKGAPQLGEDGHLSPDDEIALYRHYGVDWSGREEAPSTSGRTGVVGGAPDRGRAAGHDTSGPTTDDAMTRSEERLTVSTERREAGRARLRKYVVTEMETVTVPVRKERLVMEHEPVGEATGGGAVGGRATDGGVTGGAPIAEEEHEIVLHEERPVVTTEAVPVERVRVSKETVQETEQVSGEVRKEQIELDAPSDATTTRDQG